MKEFENSTTRNKIDKNKKLDKKEQDHDPFSIEAYEERASKILELEKNNEIIGEIIDGPKIPLKVLRNNFNKSSKKLILLIHGTGMNEFFWAPALKSLEKEEINAVTYAWRGHSASVPYESQELEDTDLSDYVDDANAVLDNYKGNLHLEDKDVIVVGHSFGAVLGTYLSRKRKLKSVLNFCAGFPNEEYFLDNNVNTANKTEITKTLGNLWNSFSEEYIAKTLQEAKNNKYFRSYKDMGQLENYLSELFNLPIPKNYNGSLEKLLGPTSRKAQSRLLDPQFLLKKKDMISPTHFFASPEDRLVSPETIKKFSKMWDGTYEEIHGPHAITLSPHSEECINLIIKYANQ